MALEASGQTSPDVVAAGCTRRFGRRLVGDSGAGRGHSARSWLSALAKMSPVRERETEQGEDGAEQLGADSAA